MYLQAYNPAKFLLSMEEQYPFYAMLMLIYAQCQYELGEYRGCVHQCREGLRVSVYSKFCKMGGELYELMADAKGKQMEEEIPEAPQQDDYLPKIPVILPIFKESEFLERNHSLSNILSC